MNRVLQEAYKLPEPQLKLWYMRVMPYCRHHRLSVYYTEKSDFLEGKNEIDELNQTDQVENLETYQAALRIFENLNHETWWLS